MRRHRVPIDADRLLSVEAVLRQRHGETGSMGLKADDAHWLAYAFAGGVRYVAREHTPQQAVEMLLHNALRGKHE